MFRVASELRNHSPTKEIASTFRAKLIIFLKCESPICLIARLCVSEDVFGTNARMRHLKKNKTTNRKELWWWKSKKETIDGPGARSLWALYLRELYYTFVTPTKIRINVCNAHLPRSLSRSVGQDYNSGRHDSSRFTIKAPTSGLLTKIFLFQPKIK